MSPLDFNLPLVSGGFRADQSARFSPSAQHTISRAFPGEALWPISVNVRAIRTGFQELSLSFALTVFCLPQRPLVGRGTRRDRLTSYLRLKYGGLEPSNSSVDVFQGIGIHR
jgi:hypothetical protein